MAQLTAVVETWPIAGSFTIARGSRTKAHVVVATITKTGFRGRGECVPYARYGETTESVVSAIEAQAELIKQTLSSNNSSDCFTALRQTLQSAMPAGAARNALDCAVWDLEAKTKKSSVRVQAGLQIPKAATTAYTISLGTPDVMKAAAEASNHRPLLKVKLGGEGDEERIAAVRSGAPDTRLIVDANEAWNEKCFAANVKACALAGVQLIEQPFPAKHDAVLADITPEQRYNIPICADESTHDRKTLASVAKRYQAINVKLDKTGGLTEALALVAEAKTLGLRIMVGCMVGTSLAMAPAMLLANDADFVDLDGPLLLARDREPGLHFEGSLIHPPLSDLWG